MKDCLGGTKDNPCNNESKYTLEWVMEDVHLCQSHYEKESNAKLLREQIAQEIEAFKNEGQFSRGFPGSEENVLDIAVGIARGIN